MGDIFCLIILESGSRRKLKLQTGTYNELLGSLAGIVEVGSNNTLVQIFDTDLDDFVDLLPGDIVPNKAKLRVIQKTASALCTPAGNAVPQSTLQIVSASSVANSQSVKQESQELSILPTSTSSLAVPVGTSGGEALLDTSDGEDDTSIDYAEYLELTEDEPEGDHKTRENAIMRLSQIPDVLRAMLPNCTTSEMVGDLAELDTVPAKEHDRGDYLKFTLPSFGTWCDVALRKRVPLTSRIRRHIINTLFDACFKITLYPTRRLYRRAIDSLVMKYPHLVAGPYDWQRWCLALRAKYKYFRRRIPEPLPRPGEAETREHSKEGCRKEGRKRTLADLERVQETKRRWLDELDEPTNSDCAPEFPGETVEPGNSEAAPFQVEPEQEDGEKEPYHCPEISDTVLTVEDEDKDITAADLLRMCTDESAAEKLAEKAAIESPPSGQKSDSSSSEETSEEVPDFSPTKMPSTSGSADYLQFELPPFTALQSALDAKHPLTGKLRCQIMHDLYTACCKITLYPSARLYRTAVDTLLAKYPHLLGSDDTTGRQLWIDRLRAKFKNVRRGLPHEVLNMYDYGGKGSAVVARRLAKKDANDKPDAEEAVRRTTRALHLEKKLRATKPSSSELKASPQAAAKEDAPVAPEELGQLLEAKTRHDTVKEMPVEQAIQAFPCYRQESSLLAEFKALWKVDIAEAFEKGIKRLFLVLMNSGTPQEIIAISGAEGEILQVVLDAIAKRCREKMSAVLAEDTTYPTPCLVKRPNGSLEVFVDGYYLFTASSLLGGFCALFASFWVFHIEYPRDARKMLTFLEHAFLNLNYTKPQLKTWELINLYRGSSP